MARLDVLELEPRVVGQLRVAQVVVDGINPAVGEVENVLLRVVGV
jgi:hypothetical protein